MRSDRHWSSENLSVCSSSWQAAHLKGLVVALCFLPLCAQTTVWAQSDQSSAEIDPIALREGQPLSATQSSGEPTTYVFEATEGQSYLIRVDQHASDVKVVVVSPGEYRDSARSQAGLAASIPMFLAAMVLIVIALFNALRQPLIIWLAVPLSVIGVTAGLLLTQQPFGFMALLGFMSLSGMLIKNAIVLIDEIEIQKRKDQSVYDAIMTSGVSRLRPVSMAALTTALGMIPLLLDAFFVAMAVTIIFGLMVATVLTMLVVPVLYATFFGVASPE